MKKPRNKQEAVEYFDSLPIEIRSKVISNLTDDISSSLAATLSQTDIPESVILQSWMTAPYYLYATTQVQQKFSGSNNHKISDETCSVVADRLSYINVVLQALWAAFVDHETFGRNPTTKLTMTNADGTEATICINNFIVDAETFTMPQDDSLKVTFE